MEELVKEEVVVKRKRGRPRKDEGLIDRRRCDRDWAWQRYRDDKKLVPPWELVFRSEDRTGLELFQQFFLFLTQVKTVDKSDGTIKGYPIEWRYLRKFALEQLYNPTLAVLKARQMLITISFAARCIFSCMKYDNYPIAVVSRRAEEANEFLRRFIDPMYEYLPNEWKRGKRELYRRIKNEREFRNGSLIKSFPPRGTSGRGITGRLAILDEAGFYPDLNETIAGLQPILDTHGSMIVSSTPKKMNQGFYQLIQEAEEGTQGWVLHKIPWNRRPDRDENWALQMKATMPEQEWLSEYCLQFISAGVGVVFNEYNERIHLVEDMPIVTLSQARGRDEATPVYCALDPHTTKPTAVLWMAVLPDNTWYVIKELWSKGTMNQLVDEIRLIERDWRVVDRVIDPFANTRNRLAETEPLRLALSREHHLVLRTAIRSRLGLERIQDRLSLGALGKPMLLINSRCTKLREQMRSYCEKDDKSAERGGQAHFVDCLKYIANLKPTYYTKEIEEAPVRSAYAEHLHRQFEKNLEASMRGQKKIWIPTG